MSAKAVTKTPLPAAALEQLLWDQDGVRVAMLESLSACIPSDFRPEFVQEMRDMIRHLEPKLSRCEIAEEVLFEAFGDDYEHEAVEFLSPSIVRLTDDQEHGHEIEESESGELGDQCSASHSRTSSGRSDRFQKLFRRDAELIGGERRGFLDAECETEPELRAEVEQLLAHYKLSSTSDLRDQIEIPTAAAAPRPQDSESESPDLNDEPIVGRPPSAAYQFRKFAKRNKASVGCVAAVFAVLLGGIVLTERRFAEARQKHLEIVTELQASMLGDDHSDTLRSLNSMAVTLQALRMRDEAEKYYREALENRDVVARDRAIAAGDGVGQMSLSSGPPPNQDTITLDGNASTGGVTLSNSSGRPHVSLAQRQPLTTMFPQALGDRTPPGPLMKEQTYTIVLDGESGDVRGAYGDIGARGAPGEPGAGTAGSRGTALINRQELKPGFVMVMDATRSGHLRLSTHSYDKRVAGIVCGAGGLLPGMTVEERLDGSNDLPIALSGRVYCYVDASEHAVEIGDLLTTSDTPGYAMKAVDRERAFGAVLGKAMQPLAKGEKGLVLVLVALQ